MKTYIALLRGINVSGQKKIKMADLRAMLENLGYASVITYIQSGNVIFKSNEETTTSLESVIKNEILNHFGYDVPVLVMTPAYLQSLYNENPFIERLKNNEIEEKKMYFTMLSEVPNSKMTDQIAIHRSEGEAYFIEGKVVYFYASNGYGKTKLSNNLFEKKLKCTATTRNLKTVLKLLELGSLKDV
ncbi:DUF1697 domain-containing protein [Aquimarina sp. RZ0]|uniref:DUF1697 domain-containing protein n=1 Tax=Aquimarina sp. RZ0 TaxID=2607730 RepID=UPI0011F269E3|nr:DUF1697 domain-containing protein [Aquimarina sp. RZ0]KAA1243881.1 DUF1697 domain-containing protein [Aquimarina sp. RZ0]